MPHGGQWGCEGLRRAPWCAAFALRQCVAGLGQVNVLNFIVEGGVVGYFVRSSGVARDGCGVRGSEGGAEEKLYIYEKLEASREQGCRAERIAVEVNGSVAWQHLQSSKWRQRLHT